MPSPQDAFKGFFLTQLSANLNSLSTAEGVAPEWCRRWILNNTTIDANGVLHLGLVTFSDIGGIAPSTLDANVGFSGVCGMFSNSSVNTFNVIADTLEVSSLTNHYQNVSFISQGSPTVLLFSDSALAPDIVVQREYAGALSVTGTAGGGITTFTTGESSERLIILNDAGGIGFANGTVTEDVYLSRISPGILGIGQTGYGTFDANLQVSLLNANTLTVAGLTTLTGLHVAGNVAFTQRLGVGGTVAGSVNGDITVARSTNPVNTGVIYLGTDGNGYLFRSNSSSMTIPLGLVVGLLTVNSTVVTINTVTAITTTALCNGVANTLHFTNGLLTSIT